MPLLKQIIYCYEVSIQATLNLNSMVYMILFDLELGWYWKISICSNFYSPVAIGDSVVSKVEPIAAVWDQIGHSVGGRMQVANRVGWPGLWQTSINCGQCSPDL